MEFFWMENEQLDLNLLNGYLETLDHSTLAKMLALYQQQSTVYIEEIKQALSENSQQLWQEQCHKMKGAAGSVGLIQVYTLLVNIEKSSAEHLKKAEYLLQLQQINTQAMASFQQWLKS